MLSSMGFLMSKIHSLVNPFHSQPALFARVCLPAPWQAGLPWRRTSSEATLHLGNNGKSIGVELNLHPYADLSLTRRHTLRCSATLQNA